MTDYIFKVNSNSNQLQIDGNSDVYFLAEVGSLAIDNFDYTTKVSYSSTKLTYPLVFFKPNTGRYTQFGWHSRNGNLLNGFYMQSQQTSVVETIDWKLFFPYSLSSNSNTFGLEVFNNRGEPTLKDFGEKLIIKKVYEVTLERGTDWYDATTKYVDVTHNVTNAYFLLSFIPIICSFVSGFSNDFYKVGLKKISDSVVRIGWSLFPGEVSSEIGAAGNIIVLPPTIKLLVIGD